MCEVPEYAGANDGVPTIRAGCYFAEVKANNGSSAEGDRFDQLYGLIEVQSARYRCARMWAKVRAESVDVETDVHMGWQLIGDLFGEFSPRGVIVELCVDVLIKKCLDATRYAAHGCYFFFAEVADANLHEFAHRRDLHGIVHDGSMGVGESFIAAAQVGMGIDLQYAEPIKFAGQRAKQTEGGAVVAAKDGNALSLLQPMLSGLLGEDMQVLMPFVHFVLQHTGGFGLAHDIVQLPDVVDQRP